jgi:soluble lytic murein transglycosylase-like protein
MPQAKQALAAAIRRAADSAGVEPALSVAVARAESNLDPRAKSSDGLSVGTFQVTHYT